MMTTTVRALAAELLEAADDARRALAVTAAPTEAPAVVRLHLTDVPARDLPLALVHDVVTVLRAHGLDPDLLTLSTALYEVILSTPAERGGSSVQVLGR